MTPRRRARGLDSVSVRATVGWGLLGNGVYGLSQWLVVIVLARLGTPDMLGTYALALAITAPVDMLARMQLRVLLATDATQQYRFGDYFGLQLLALVPSIAMSVVAGGLLGYDAAIVILVAIVGLAKQIEASSDVAYGQMQLHERQDHVAGSLAVKGVLSVLSFYVPLRLGAGLEIAALALAASWLAIFLARDLTVVRRLLGEGSSSELVPRWERDRLKPLFAHAFPLGVVTALGTLKVSAPRLVVEHRLGTTDLGALAAMAYLVILGGRFVASTLQATAARLGRARARGDRAQFWRTMRILLAVAAGSGLVGAAATLVAGDWFIPAIYGAHYSAYTGLLLLLMVASCFDYSSQALQLGLTASGRNRPQLVMRVAGITATVGGTVALVGPMGVGGAAVGLLLGSALECAIAIAVFSTSRGAQ